MPGCGGEISRPADITLIELPREKGPQEIAAALLLWGDDAVPSGVEISRYLNFADTVCLSAFDSELAAMMAFNIG